MKWSISLRQNSYLIEFLYEFLMINVKKGKICECNSKSRIKALFCWCDINFFGNAFEQYSYTVVFRILMQSWFKIILMLMLFQVNGVEDINLIIKPHIRIPPTPTKRDSMRCAAFAWSSSTKMPQSSNIYEPLSMTSYR